MGSRLWTGLLLTALLMAGWGGASEEITLENPGFEKPSLLNGAMGVLAGWRQAGNGQGNTYNVAAGKSPAPTEGANVGLLWSKRVSEGVNHTIYQTPLARLAPNTGYTLTFDIGNPSGRLLGDGRGRWENTFVTVRVYLTVGTDTRLESAAGNTFTLALAELPRGAFLTDQRVTLHTDRFAGRLNQPLNIVFRLEKETTPLPALVGCFIDNVRLSISP